MLFRNRFFLKPVQSIFFAMVIMSSTAFLPISAAAQSNETTGRTAAAGIGKQAVKRVVLPIFAVMAVVDGANAYEQHCQRVPDEEAFACTAEAFTREQVNELRALGYDISEAWTYVIVPYARHFWDQNGDDIKAGARVAADTAADAAIATGDAIVEYAPKVWNWLSDQLE